MKKKILLLFTFLSINFALCTEPEGTIETAHTEEDQSNEIDNEKVDLLKKTVSKEPLKTKVTKKLPNQADSKELVREQKVFVNCRPWKITLIVSDKNNKTHNISIDAGQKIFKKYPLQHVKKIICYDGKQENITMTQNQYNTYTVFIFNADNKLEGHHFYTIHDKTKALKRIGQNNDPKKYDEVEKQTVYLQ